MGGADHMVVLRLFGHPNIEVGGDEAKFRTKKTAQLLVYLTVKQGEPVPRDVLADLFWPESGQDTARQSLRMSLSDIRAVLGFDPFVASKEDVLLPAATIKSDYHEFTNLVASAQGSGAERGELARAVALVQGPLLDGIASDWAVHLWLRIQDLYAFAVTRLLELSTDENHWQAAAMEGHRALQILGCREEIHSGLMKLFLARGLTTRAIQQFEALETELDEQWGEKPSAATLRLLEEAPEGRGLVDITVARTQPDSDGIIGRQDTLTMLEAALPHGKPGFVTLVGTGGAGKTTIARALIRRRLDAGLEACFVDLSPATTVDGMIHALQSALELPVTNRTEGVAAISRRLATSPTLVVLDNLEQALPQAAETLAALATKSGKTSFLGTSRTPVDIEPEVQLAVEPMSVPERPGQISEMRAYDAVALFEREAVRANPEFRLTPSNIAPVVELCRILDGLPLAITLAASRIRIFSPSEILGLIVKSPKWLKSDFADQDHRHASLFSAIDWSYRLLPDNSKSLALALATFHSPVPCQHLARVAGVDDADEALNTLVRSGLAIADVSKNRSYYSTYATVKAYLGEMLAMSGNEEAARTAHMALWEEAAIEAHTDPKLRTLEKVRWFITSSHEITGSVSFGLTQNGLRGRAAELLCIYSTVTQSVSSSEKTTELLRRAYDDQTGLTNHTVAKVLNQLALLSGNSHSIQGMSELLMKAAKLGERDELLQADILHNLACLYKSSGQHDLADQSFQKSREIYESQLNTLGAARCLYGEALNAYCVSDFERNSRLLQLSLEQIRKVDSPVNTVRILYDVGSLMFLQENFERGFALFEEALDICQELDSIKLEGLTRWLRAGGYLKLEKYEEAHTDLVLAMNLVVAADFEAGLKWMFIKLAEALHHTGADPLAAQWLGWGEATRNLESRPLAEYEVRGFDHALGLVSGSLGETRLERYLAEGRRMDGPTLVRLTNESAATPISG